MMKIIQQLLLSFFLLFISISAQSAPSCVADSDMVKLLSAMTHDEKLATAIKENPKLALLWKRIGTEKFVEAWTVLEGDKTLRKDKDNIQKIFFFIKFEKADPKALKKSFDKLTDSKLKKKWVKLKITQAILEGVSIPQNPPPVLIPWTTRHKAQRWRNYQAGKAARIKAGKKSLKYVAWSNVYDGNINKTKIGDKAVKDYAKKLPTVRPDQFEVTSKDKYKITLTHNGRNEVVEGKRRHDINVRDHAYEVKDYRSGKVYLSADIEREVLMDKAMKDDGAVKTVTWVFTKHPGGNGRPSQPLLDLLKKNGIAVKYRNP